ncbi:MAG: hypothetical protein KAI47_13460 [Deltaproteobacteria bacterium]|nr:hypothetical protein [Deltaproteobacteria bacterium]
MTNDTALVKISALRDDLENHLLEREVAIEAALLALLTGSWAFFFHQSFAYFGSRLALRTSSIFRADAYNSAAFQSGLAG